MASDTKPIDSKPLEMKPKEAAPKAEPSAVLSRETRLGMAVAGSFAVLVGGVFGVKQIVGVDKQTGAAAQVRLTDEKPVVQAPTPAFPSDPNNINIDLSGIAMPKMPLPDPAQIEPQPVIKGDLSGIEVPKVPVADTTKAEPHSMAPRMEMPKAEGKDDFNAPTTKAVGLTLAKFEEPKKIELPQKFDAPPPLPALPASGPQTELAPITVPKIELKPIQTESTAIKTPAADPSMPMVPAIEPVKKPEQATPEINVTVPKLQDFSPPPAPAKTNPPELPKMDPPIKLDPAPLNIGESTIKPLNSAPSFQPASRSGDNDPVRIDMESVKPKADAPRTTITVPATTMENREPRTIPVETAVRRNAKDFDEDLHEPKPGDNYAMISKKYYDEAGYATALAEYNKSNPTNNKMVRIPPLWVLEQNHAKAMPASNIRTTSMTAPANDRRDNAPPPSAEAREEAKSSPFNGMRVYTVQRPGETLRSIAQNQLGSANAWKSVKDYNISVDENAELSPGTKLYMPPGTRE